MMAQNWYRIENVGPAGLGMVAARQISRGTVILEEKPLLIFDTEVRDSTTFYANERNCKSDIIHPKIKRVRDKKKAAAVRALHHLDTADPRENDIDIVEKNGWGFEKDGHRWVSVFDHMSRINHSCVPNARVTKICTRTCGLGSMKLIATKDIMSNDEITVEYVQDGVWLRPRNERRNELQNWSFLCTCPACGNKNALLKETELAHLNAVNSEISLPLPRQFQPSDSLANKIWRAEYYTLWLKEFGYGDERLTEAYHRLAELYVKANRHVEARQTIFLGFEIESHEYETSPWIIKLLGILSQCGGKY